MKSTKQWLSSIKENYQNKQDSVKEKTRETKLETRQNKVWKRKERNECEVRRRNYTKTKIGENPWKVEKNVHKEFFGNSATSSAATSVRDPVLGNLANSHLCQQYHHSPNKPPTIIIASNSKSIMLKSQLTHLPRGSMIVYTVSFKWTGLGVK